jgi:predicted RecB family nuclease
VLLGAYAACSCPVKTQNAFDPTCRRHPTEPDESLAELFDGGAAFRAEVLDGLADRHRERLVDLRAPLDPTPAARRAACLAALESGAELVVGGWLPVDVVGRRHGQPDFLVRGADQDDGRPRYHPVVVKWHKVIERRSPGRAAAVDPGGALPEPSLAYTTVARPRPLPVSRMAGQGLRVASREADLLQLAHYHRMLVAAGYADDGDARAAVIGTDAVLVTDAVLGTDSAGTDTAGETVLAWVDLAEPLVRTFSRSEREGWRLRSLLERYEHEYAFRLDIATVASRQTGRPDRDPALLVRPIVTNECGRCPWWEHCRPQLDPGDVSLRIDKGPLDVREIATLRAQGVRTITDLAGADLPSLLTSYLPEVTHRREAESRLRTATRRARMLLDDRAFERETTGAIAVPEADVEIDFDIETSAQGRVYLWGFLVTDTRSAQPSCYRAFCRFEDLDPAAELELARQALSWLHEQVEGGKVEGDQSEGGKVEGDQSEGGPVEGDQSEGYRSEGGEIAVRRSVRVYHYSSYEVSAIRALAERGHDPVLEWALSYASREFVDLLEVVQTHFFGVAGLGLKVVGQRGAGFQWRDEDPGGLNSQRWFADAVHEHDGSARAAARQRVLDYNEDDVTATARVRAWLRAS